MSLLRALSSVTAAILQEYVDADGMIRCGGKNVSPEAAASPSGMLPPIVWWCKEFEESFGLEFPGLLVDTDPVSMTGFTLSGLAVESVASPSTFMLSDFLRKEILPMSAHELDLTQVAENFKQWAAVELGLAVEAEQTPE
jgi:hypothetical protein